MAFFEPNVALYWIADYSFPSVKTLGGSVIVDATFTITSASGVE
jgi:hypothetical protein